jgi:pilus assembly protein Flp/PilA
MMNWLVGLKEAAVAVHRDESGQDLIEYALVAALIALAAVVGMSTVANAINNAFSLIGSRLSSAVT